MKKISDYDGADYEGNFWQMEGRAYDDQVERIALRRLVPRGGRLLELASGYGRLTNLYKGYQQVVLVDYHPPHLEAARDRYGLDGYLYVAADIYRLPFAPAQFDVATMIRALHHMEDPLAALRQARGSLRSGGVLVLEFANKHNLKTMTKWHLRRIPLLGRRWGSRAVDPYSPQPSEYYSLYYGLHPEYVQGTLKQAGFMPNRRLAVSYLRLPLIRRTPLRGLLVRLDSLLQLTGDRWQLSPNGFVRSEAVGEDETNLTGAFWRCPACLGLGLTPEPDGLRCGGCGRSWPVRDGIHDFRMPVGPGERVLVTETAGW